MTAYQAIIGIVMATTWHAEIVAHDPTMSASGSLAALWIHNIVCILLAVAYGALTAFHVYLLVLRMGTYDYILKYGANNRCIRLLRCQCRGSKALGAKKNGPKSPAQNDKDSIATTVASDRKASKSKVGHTASVVHSSKESSAQPSSAEIAAWKAEWIKKHGSDGDDVVRPTESLGDLARTRKQQALPTVPDLTLNIPRSIDLVQLYEEVVDKGGYDAVSKNARWPSVALSMKLKIAPTKLQALYATYEWLRGFEAHQIGPKRHRDTSDEPTEPIATHAEIQLTTSVRQTPLPVVTKRLKTHRNQLSDLGVMHRFVLALDSNLPDHVEWALNQLIVLSFGSPKDPDCDLLLAHVPGLLDALLRQIHLSSTHADPSLLSSSMNPDDVNDVSVFEHPVMQADRTCRVLHILRNLAMVPDNQTVLASHTAVLDLLPVALKQSQPDMPAREAVDLLWDIAVQGWDGEPESKNIDVEVRDCMLHLLYLLTDRHDVVRVAVATLPAAMRRLVVVMTSCIGRAESARLAVGVLSNLALAPATLPYFLPVEKELVLVAMSDPSLAGMLANILVDVYGMNSL
ncbi:hypothetical protein DYB32_007242 [Aphanomyces invadans]|uniref:ARID domain-containing protein n=1 Tax=Aphanomyces invadans TaxID=157072 RepID=A0A3R6Z0M9_9STRA|nr:hypothetical protein DYB32_007242 [Aphanomyces invadans]